MLRFGRQLNLMNVPQERLNKTLDRVLGQVIREAAREWLRHIVVEVPVETGMAKGALQPLGRRLRVTIPISPTRKPYQHSLEGVVATPAAGAAMTDFELVSKGHQYIFTWTNEILHYWLAEHYKGPATPGEQLMLEAGDIFEQHVYSTMEHRLPQILQGLIEVEYA